LGKVELFGMDNIPKDNRYVIAFNHVSLVEVPFIAAFWPVPIDIIGTHEVRDRPLHNIVGGLYSFVSVNRDEFDREVFKQVDKVFLAGRPLMISPEGTRSRTPGLQRGKPGVAYIIDKANVDVVPVGVVGNTYEFLSLGFRGKNPTIQMFVGEAFRLPPLDGRGAKRREMRQRNTDYIMAKVAALLPESYQGVYRNHEKILAGETIQF
jgi:1-acyl-sn-glycerol-3-phosphate acyltransferase